MFKNQSIFKTPELENQYLSLYDAVLDLWSTTYEPIDVPTRFGLTHINATGPKDGSVLMLLPGFSANSTMWYPNIAALSSQFRIYAVDTNGQPGKSLPAQKLTASNSADWIAEVLDGLGLEKVNLVGISLGGWLVLNFVIRKPGRVARVVLLDPVASFEKVSSTFMWHSFLPIMAHPTRAGLVKYFRWITQGYKVNDKWGELMVLGILNTRPQPPIRPYLFSDEDLRKVQTPILLLIGGKSVIYNPQRVYRRATRLISDIQAEVIPNASHALNAEKSDYVNARILQFCQK